MRNIIKKVTSSDKLPIIILLIGIIITFSILSSAFFTFDNIRNVLRQVSMIGIAGIGMVCVILTGGIDLSIGSLVAFVNILCAFLMANMGVNPVIASIIGIIAATMVGAINGFFVAYCNLTPMISTLCMMNILRGICFVTTNGLPVFGFPESSKFLGQGYIGVIPVPVIIFIIFIAIGYLLLNKTYIGRYFYAVGGNEEAVTLSGINTKRVKMTAYILCGFFTGIAGVIWLSRVNSGQPSTGTGFEFDVISGIVLGGLSVMGGVGSISGAMIGVIAIGFLNNGLVLMNVNEYYQLIAKGLVLLIAIGLDSFKRNLKGKTRYNNNKNKIPELNKA